MNFSIRNVGLWCIRNGGRMMKTGLVACKETELDLGVTLNGGQSFRWVASKDGQGYRGVFASTVWTLERKGQSICYTSNGTLQLDLNCEKLLSDYFRLDVSLKKNLNQWTKVDPHFGTSYGKFSAVRILSQDIVENLFSFICSSNNNITRISGMVEKLSRFFGKKICDIEGTEYYDFPTIDALCGSEVESILRKEGFGYRAAYISKSAQKLQSLGGREWLTKLQKQNGASYDLARESLLTLTGIGPKVADCICLMSLGHLEAIPVDTHIFQVACANYTPHLKLQKSVTPKIHHEISSHLRQLWGPYAGWAQAIVFCAKINSAVQIPKVKKRPSNSNLNKVVKVKTCKK